MGFAIALVLILDQLTKKLAMEQTNVFTIFPGLKFIRVTNKGIAFGFFSEISDVLVWVILGAVLFISTTPFFLRYREKEKFALGLIIGGALGNLLDRLRLGYVVDFLQLEFYPAIFNVADIFIIIGGALLIVFSLRREKSEKLRGYVKGGRLETGYIRSGESTGLGIKIYGPESHKRRKDSSEWRKEKTELQGKERREDTDRSSGGTISGGGEA